MPIFDDDTMTHNAIDGCHYGYSATRIDALAAAEYTLVGIAADVSGSVTDFRAEIEECIRAVVSACASSPRADNLMARITMFDDTVHEIQGFRPLAACDPDGYRGAVQIGGTTALYDAAVNNCEAIRRYGATLGASAFSTNAIVFVITDGMDNASTHDANDVGTALKELVRSEALASVHSVLIGVDVSGDALSLYLNRLRKDAGFDRYIELGDATEASLARLASFVSVSIAAQSQALAHGRPTGPVQF